MAYTALTKYHITRCDPLYVTLWLMASSDGDEVQVNAPVVELMVAPAWEAVRL